MNKVVIDTPAMRLPDGTIFKGETHAQILGANMGRFVELNEVGYKGYIDSEGNFQNRHAAAIIANTANQVAEIFGRVMELQSYHIPEEKYGNLVKVKK